MELSMTRIIRPKITVVGAGNVGATAALWMAREELGDIVLVDIAEGIPQGKALDISQAAPVLGFDVKLVGSNGYEETSNSDVVVITAGFPRKPGMSRDDLLEKNSRIVGMVAKEVRERSPHAVLMIVTNPLDAMCFVARHVTGFPRERVFGMAGVLDTGRFRCFLAEALDVSVEDVHAYVLGGHGDTMVPLIRYTTAGGVPVENFLSPEELKAIVDRTRFGGGEMVKLMGTSAYVAPGAAIATMVESIVRDKKRIFPVAAYLDGEFGTTGHYLGVPCKLGRKGLERIIEIKLNDDEQAALNQSIEHVKELTEATRRFL
jgi:malate dehydrogenase